MRSIPRTLPAVLALALPLTLAACGGDGEAVSPLSGEAATQDEQTDAADDQAASASPGTGAPIPVAGVTERTVAHVQADVTVLSAEVSYETPGSKTGDMPDELPGEVPYLYVQVKVTNRLLNEGLLLQDGIYLDLGTGDLLPNVLNTDASGNIDPGTTASGWYGFELPGPDAPVQDAALVLGELDRRQDTLPLTGEVPEPEYPRTIHVESPGTVLTGEAGGSQEQCPMSVKITDATLAPWIGFDRDGTSYLTEQAAADSLMVLLELDASTPKGAISCFVAIGDELHLVVDGERRGDLPQFYEAGVVPEGTTDQQFVVYEIPADARVELEWGNLTGKTVLTEIPVP
ncbi:hypothetical protein [Myceligenerans indicum]|uniref:DUF4352 domain-containing protein n=1 Tax=Myceligenerans indicum TaxID=2593663 RepID=A0ABS1LJY5_9MICO|nr:hypothetical protein [Myceligenerans indicum]MBL0886560.1 hypothetical protein [Myceligenerans indicum]